MPLPLPTLVKRFADSATPYAKCTMNLLLSTMSPVQSSHGATIACVQSEEITMRQRSGRIANGGLHAWTRSEYICICRRTIAADIALPCMILKFPPINDHIGVIRGS